MDAYEEALEQPFLEQYGLNLEQVGIAQTVDFIPWCIKFVWAIPSDSYDFFGFGHRRPYVVLGLLLGAISYAAITLFNPGTYIGLYMLCMVFRNIGIAIADCAVDGLSVDCDLDTEAGAIQGWMSVGRTGGTVLASLSANSIAKTSYTMAILASAAFVFIPIPANLFIKEEWVDEKAYEDKIDDIAEVNARQKVLDSHGKLDDNKHHASTNAADDKKGRVSGGVTGGCHAIVPGNVTTNAACLPPSTNSSSSSSTIQRTGIPLPPTVSEQAETEERKEMDQINQEIETSKKALKRRKSFVARVATTVGFDWDMLKEILSMKHVYLFLIYLALATLGVAITNFSLTVWAHNIIGMDIDEVGAAMSVMSVGCVLASLPMGYLFDYVPSKRSMMFFAAFVCGLSNLSLVFCTTKTQAYLGLFGFGAAHGIIYVVQCSMARILADMRIAAAFFGIVNSICNLQHAIGTAVGGPIAERVDPIANFWVGAMIDFLAVLFVFLMPEKELTLNRQDTTTKRWKILPHRMALKFSELRRTVLNTTYEALQQEDDNPELEKSNAIMTPSKIKKSLSRRPSFAINLAKGEEYNNTGYTNAGDIVLNPLVNVDKTDSNNHELSSSLTSTETSVLSKPGEVTAFLATLPSYVPVAQLDLPTKYVSSTSTSLASTGPSSRSSSAGKSRRPSVREYVTTIVDSLQPEEVLRAPRNHRTSISHTIQVPNGNGTKNSGAKKFTMASLLDTISSSSTTSLPQPSRSPHSVPFDGIGTGNTYANIETNPYRRTSVAAAIANNELGTKNTNNTLTIANTKSIANPLASSVVLPSSSSSSSTVRTVTLSSGLEIPITSNITVMDRNTNRDTVTSTSMATSDRRTRLALMQHK